MCASPSPCEVPVVLSDFTWSLNVQRGLIKTPLYEISGKSLQRFSCYLMHSPGTQTRPKYIEPIPINRTNCDVLSLTKTSGAVSYVKMECISNVSGFATVPIFEDSCRFAVSSYIMRTGYIILLFGKCRGFLQVMTHPAVHVLSHSQSVSISWPWDAAALPLEAFPRHFVLCCQVLVQPSQLWYLWHHPTSALWQFLHLQNCKMSPPFRKHILLVTSRTALFIRWTCRRVLEKLTVALEILRMFTRTLSWGSWIQPIRSHHISFRRFLILSADGRLDLEICLSSSSFPSETRAFIFPIMLHVLPTSSPLVPSL